MRIDGNGGAGPNYSPNGRGGPVDDRSATEAPIALSGTSGRTEYPRANCADDFEQAGLLYRVMSEEERVRLVANLAGHMKPAAVDTQQRMVQHFASADPEYGARVARALGL